MNDSKTVLEHVPLLDLETAAKARRERLNALVQQRDQHAAELERIESEIAHLRDGKPAGKGTIISRALSKPALEWVLEAMNASGKPMNIRTVAKRIERRGYKTKTGGSAFGTVAVVLAQNRGHFQRVEKGVYRLRHPRTL